ncbi:MAG TPA: protein archease [Anaerolineaceae bacterium]|nr:protein archease [Anaerolineaceae bacterium]
MPYDLIIIKEEKENYLDLSRWIMPFEELDHIGESAFRVSAGTLEELFQQAANAMYFTMQVKVFGSAKHQNLSLRGPDSESLLVMFLNELLILAESENLASYASTIRFDDHWLQADLALSPITHKVENIKAVTFSQMNITRNESGFETIIVFDL